MNPRQAVRNLNVGLAGVIDERTRRAVRRALDALPAPKAKPVRPKRSAAYERGFADGVASTNTERAEARAQIETLTARVRALTTKKGRGK